jgi:VWFA-related protein
MLRGTAVYVVPLAFAVAIDSPLPQAQQPAPFTASTNVVVVPVVVVDNDGATVPNLAASDFVVSEDGKPVEITTFVPPATAGQPGSERFIVLALDNLYTDPAIAWRLKSVARRFADRLEPGDVMSVVSLNGGNATTTTSKPALKAAIDKYKASSDEGSWRPGDKGRHALSMLGLLSEQIAKPPHRRKIVVVIGSPWLFVPHTGSAQPDLSQSPEWMDAVRSTSRNNVAIYMVDPAGLQENPNQFRDWADSFTEHTGGAAWTNSNNFDGAANRIWTESSSYYLLGYAAPIADQRIHTINVKVSRKGVTVRARKARG